MARRIGPRYRVRLTDHARQRWAERVGTCAKRVEGLLTALLIEQLGVGLPGRNGQYELRVKAERLGTEYDVLALLELPDFRGNWAVPTVIMSAQEESHATSEGGL